MWYSFQPEFSKRESNCHRALAASDSANMFFSTCCKPFFPIYSHSYISIKAAELIKKLYICLFATNNASAIMSEYTCPITFQLLRTVLMSSYNLRIAYGEEKLETNILSV